jgi:hypothetical protein
MAREATDASPSHPCVVRRVGHDRSGRVPGGAGPGRAADPAGRRGPLHWSARGRRCWPAQGIWQRQPQLTRQGDRSTSTCAGSRHSTRTPVGRRTVRHRRRQRRFRTTRQGSTGSPRWISASGWCRNNPGHAPDQALCVGNGDVVEGVNGANGLYIAPSRRPRGRQSSSHCRVLSECMARSLWTRTRRRCSMAPTSQRSTDGPPVLPRQRGLQHP